MASSPELEQQLRELVAEQIEELPKPPPGTRRAIIVTAPSIGERRFCLQLGDVLTKFGYEWCICSNAAARMAEKMNPDIFIQSASWMTIPPPSNAVSLLYIHSPYCVSPANYQYASTYDNFLFAQAGTDGLEKYLRENGKNFRQLKTYLTLGKTDFSDKLKTRIAYVGYLHDPRRKNELAQLFQLLDGTGYCDFYGPSSSWRAKCPHSWKNSMPFRGPRDVQDVMEPAGIALLLHAKQQFESGSPVYRDFEALSSSCVIITEKTAFMRENFSDCALFIDTDRPVEEIFEQIDAHVRWIHAHPEEAVEMARRSHQIFCDKFSLEGECEKILKFVDEILAASLAHQSDGDTIEQETVGNIAESASAHLEDEPCHS
jgi:glycosyltransferase involved in cell wall biosynthesis